MRQAPHLLVLNANGKEPLLTPQNSPRGARPSTPKLQHCALTSEAPRAPTHACRAENASLPQMHSTKNNASFQPGCRDDAQAAAGPAALHVGPARSCSARPLMRMDTLSSCLFRRMAAPPSAQHAEAPLHGPWGACRSCGGRPRPRAQLRRQAAQARRHVRPLARQRGPRRAAPPPLCLRAGVKT